MTQSRQLSLIEAATNVVVGYGLAVAMQITVFPWFGLNATVEENLAIGALFTAISLIRGYALRRLFAPLDRQQKGPAEAGPES
jgi:hypothetical protein